MTGLGFPVWPRRTVTGSLSQAGLMTTVAFGPAFIAARIAERDAVEGCVQNCHPDRHRHGHPRPPRNHWRRVVARGAAAVSKWLSTTNHA